MPRLRTLAALAFSFSLGVPAIALANCGAEGCPFVRDAMHASHQRFSFDLRYQEVTQDQLWSGSEKTTLEDIIADAELHGEVELYTRTRSWVAEGRVQVLPALSLVATVPYVQREHRHWLAHTPVFNPLFVDEWKYEGLADATVIAQYRALSAPGLPSIQVQAGAKLPTGRKHLPDEARDNFGFESTLEPSARPGTGSTDWVAGLLVSQNLPWKSALPVTASVNARFTGKGTDDYEVGDEVQAGLASGFSPTERVTLLGQLNYSQHTSDQSADPSEAAHSGMKSLYLTPGVSVNVAPMLSIYALYQARVWAKSDEPTVIGNGHFMIGTNWSFGI